MKIFLRISNASATAGHWVKKWSRGFLPRWDCNFKQQYFMCDAPGRDSAFLKTHPSCQIRPGCWCFHVCNRAGHLSTGHICYEPYHHGNAQVNDFFESESFWIYCRKEKNCVGRERAKSWSVQHGTKAADASQTRAASADRISARSIWTFHIIDSSFHLRVISVQHWMINSLQAPQLRNSSAVNKNKGWD